MPYFFNESLASFPSLSKSAESRLGLIALASSDGYSVDRGSFSPPLGMMIEALGTREPSFGRSRRDLLMGRSRSDSDPEEEADEVGDAAPLEIFGLGRGGVVFVTFKEAITPSKGRV